MVRIVKNTSISSKLPTSTTRHHLNAKKYPLQSFWPRDRFPTLLRFWTTTSTFAAKYILDTALNNPFSNPSHVAYDRATANMSLAESSSSALHIDFPASTGSGVMHSRSVSGVHVHPVALFSILDHYLRRNDGQHRVIGTLLGTRTESEIEIKNCFAVPHHEDDEEGQVQVDLEYHRNMYELCQKVRPDEVIVGWYATSPELNTYSALIQDFYSRETAPHQAVHLTMDTSIDGSKASGLGIKSYISSPLGATPKAENCVFLPLPTNLMHSTPEHSSLSLLASQNVSSPLSDLDAFAVSLKQVQAQLDRVLTYVRAVISGEKEGDKAVGRFLNDTISVVPAGMDDNKLETLFNAHLQDVLMVSYLANVVRAQAEVSSRLTLLT